MSMDDTTVQEKPLTNEDLQVIYLAARRVLRNEGKKEAIKNLVANMCIQGVRDFINILEDDAFKKYKKGILLFPPLVEQDFPEKTLLKTEEIAIIEKKILSNMKQILRSMGLQNCIKIEVKSC